MVNQFYKIKETSELNALLIQADELNTTIKNKSITNSLQKAIQNKLKYEWTYHSNAIEGSTLTMSETIFFLKEGLTVEGKPLKDFLDAKNHAEAVDFLYQIITNKRPISEGLIKEINAMLLLGVTHTQARDTQGRIFNKPVNAGEYKKLPNHVIQLDGTIHEYVDPVHVASEMQYLCEWINGEIEKQHPILVAAIAHYNMVRIHPFDDGNGRGARILMNLILMKKNYFPAIIKMEKRRQYIESLMQADQCNLNPFVKFVTEELLSTEQLVLKELEFRS